MAQEITIDEMDRAIKGLKKWPAEERGQILALPKPELRVVLLLVSELDARPEKP